MNTKQRANFGHLPLPCNFSFRIMDEPELRIWGGPFYEAPENYYRVKMAEEIIRPHEVSVPTRDFDVPSITSMQAGIERTMLHMLVEDSKPVFVGCMGGIGRTGLFMGCMAKAWGLPNPVEYTRANYVAPGGRRPIETEKQVQYIKDFQVTSTMLSAADLLKRRYRWRKAP